MREVHNHIITPGREDIIEILTLMSRVINIIAKTGEIVPFLRKIEEITLRENVGRGKDLVSMKRQDETKGIVATKTEATAKSIEVLMDVQLAPFLLVPSDSLLNYLSSYKLPKFTIIFQSVKSFLYSFYISSKMLIS